MYKFFAIIIGIILIIALVAHVGYFVVSESEVVNKNRNRGFEKLELKNCDGKTLIKEMELVGVPTGITPNSTAEFACHYDILMTDLNGNKYFGYVINHKLSREFRIEPITLDDDWKEFKFDKYTYFKLKNKSVSVHTTLGNILDTFEKLNKGYHVYKFNCHHKTERLINIIKNKEVFKPKKYTISYVSMNIMKEIFKNLLQIKNM